MGGGGAEGGRYGCDCGAERYLLLGAGHGGRFLCEAVYLVVDGGSFVLDIGHVAENGVKSRGYG